MSVSATLAIVRAVYKRIERVAHTYTNAHRFTEWRQDPRRHVTGAPLLCRREFAPDEAALRQQTATGVSRQAPVVLSTLRYILHGRRARGQSTLDDRRSRSSILYSNPSPSDRSGGTARKYSLCRGQRPFESPALRGITVSWFEVPVRIVCFSRGQSLHTRLGTFPSRLFAAAGTRSVIITITKCLEIHG